MLSTITYEMRGFNKIMKDAFTTSRVKIRDNQCYTYVDHPFLENVYIDDEFNKISFTLKRGLVAKDYISRVGDELEKICFNIIVHTEIPVFQPICKLVEVKDENGTECKITLNDYFSLHDELNIESCYDASDFYERIVTNKVDITNNKVKYKELFYILHSPHRVIQFMGLYEQMASMICSPIQQNKIHNFFGKNRQRYPFVNFIESRKDSSKKEDSFTFLRNSIAHSEQLGIEEFVNISKSISDEWIKKILLVIHDLICGNVKT